VLLEGHCHQPTPSMYIGVPQNVPSPAKMSRTRLQSTSILTTTPLVSSSVASKWTRATVATIRWALSMNQKVFTTRTVSRRLLVDSSARSSQKYSLISETFASSRVCTAMHSRRNLHYRGVRTLLMRLSTSQDRRRGRRIVRPNSPCSYSHCHASRAKSLPTTLGEAKPWDAAC
jgi:hypothetical protein